MAFTRRKFSSALGALSAVSLIAPWSLAAAQAAQAAQAEQAAQQAKQGGRLVWGVESEPSTLNPHLNSQAKARLILRNVFESLLANDEQGAWLPWLAAQHEVLDGGLRYVFTLREGVRFSDGQPLDAAAVALNFSRVKDASYSKNLSSGPVSRLLKAEALDPLRVQLTLSEVYAPFLSFAATLELLSPAAFDSKQLQSGGVEIAGTGPFVLASYKRGQELSLKRNPDYNWAPANAPQQGPALLDEVVYRFLPEDAVRTGALLSGQVDVIEGISGNDTGAVQGDAQWQYLRAFNSGTPYSLFLNVEYGPTQDVRVRQALQAAVDVSAVVQSVYRGQRQRAWGITAPGAGEFYDASIENAYGFDASKANRLLDEAGWTTRDAEGYRSKDGKRLTIEVVQAQNTVRDQRDVLLLAVQAQARQHAGIDLAIVYVDQGTYAQRRNEGDFGSIPNSRTPSGDGLDIEYHYLPVEAGGSINYSRVADPQVAQWLAAAAATLDQTERARLYAQLQNYALEQALVLPLYVAEDQIGAGAHVQGLRFRPFQQQPENAYGVWLKP